MYIQSLAISKIIHGGYGLGRLADGRVIMVRGVLPDEEVAVSITIEQGQAWGKVEKINRPSPARISPPCPYYGRCGGCDLQHGDYASQLTIKRAIVTDLLNRSPAPAIRASAALVAPPLASPDIFHYRQRIRLEKAGHHHLGFRKFHSHEVLPIGRCLLAREELNRVLAALPSVTAFSRLLTITLEVELLLNPGSGGVVGLFHLRRRPRPTDLDLARQIGAALPELERIFFKGTDFPLNLAYTAPAESPADHLLHMVGTATDHSAAPLILSWEVGGFCQVNLPQNEQLVALVQAWADLSPSASVLDLFCGMGNFAIPLARQAGEVLGIEGQGSAIRSARRNSLAAGLANIEFRKQPIHPCCTELVAAGRSFDCLIIDPPRAGVPGLAPLLARLSREKIIYVSCDPATLCRDLAELIGQGLTVVAIQAVDMFPHTHHLETVVLLRQKA